MYLANNDLVIRSNDVTYEMRAPTSEKKGLKGLFQPRRLCCTGTWCRNSGMHHQENLYFLRDADTFKLEERRALRFQGSK